MNYVEIEANRPEPMEPLPASDTLFQFDNGTIVRLRVTSMTTEGQVRNTATAPGENERINMKLQCSLCKDDSGDVRTGQDGNHLLLAAETHGITAETLLADSVSFDSWLATRITDILKKSAEKALIIDRVLAKYHVPAEEPARPRVTWELYEELLQRVVALEERRS